MLARSKMSFSLKTGCVFLPSLTKLYPQILLQLHQQGNLFQLINQTPGVMVPPPVTMRRYKTLNLARANQYYQLCILTIG